MIDLGEAEEAAVLVQQLVARQALPAIGAATGMTTKLAEERLGVWPVPRARGPGWRAGQQALDEAEVLFGTHGGHDVLGHVVHGPRRSRSRNARSCASRRRGPDSAGISRLREDEALQVVQRDVWPHALDHVQVANRSGVGVAVDEQRPARLDEVEQQASMPRGEVVIANDR